MNDAHNLTMTSNTGTNNALTSKDHDENMNSPQMLHNRRSNMSKLFSTPCVSSILLISYRLSSGKAATFSAIPNNVVSAGMPSVASLTYILYLERVSGVLTA